MSTLRRVALLFILSTAACGESVTATATSTSAVSTSSQGGGSTVSSVEPDVPDGAELPAPGYSCIEVGAPTIDAARLEGIEGWEPAPSTFTSTLAPESGRPMGELGNWVTWPQMLPDPPLDDTVGYDEPEPLYVLTAPLSIEPLVLLASFSEPGLSPCEVAFVEYSPEFGGYLAASRDASAAWCEVTDGEHGPSVFVYGSAGSVPTRILVDGVETQSGTTMGPTRHVDYLTPLFRAVGWPVDMVATDAGEEAVQIASFVRHLAGEGADGPVEVRASLLAADGWVDISCGSARMITAADVEIACSVDLVDGIPHVATVGTGGPYMIRRLDTELAIGPNMDGLDFAAPRGSTVSYSIEMFVSGDSVTVECGSVDVPTEIDTAAVLALARQAASSPAGPYVYWEFAFVCPGCDDAPQTVVFLVNEAPPVVDRQPEGHPGLLSPFSVHEHLLQAIAGGREVSVEFLDFGRIGTWDVDGVGLRTTCLIADTLPPDLGATYCNFTGD